jgi:hypothetical protein
LCLRRRDRDSGRRTRTRRGRGTARTVTARRKRRSTSIRTTASGETAKRRSEIGKAIKLITTDTSAAEAGTTARTETIRKTRRSATDRRRNSTSEIDQEIARERSATIDL